MGTRDRLKPVLRGSRGDDARFGGGGEAVDLVECDAQGRHEHDRVAELAEDRAVLAGGEAGAGAALLLPGVRSARRLVGHEVEAGHEAALADVTHVVERAEPGHVLPQPFDLRWQRFEHAFVAKNIQRLERDGRSQRIAAIGVAVEKRPSAWLPRNAFQIAAVVSVAAIGR